MLVSILIPCYNAERWIGEAIESALSQSWGSKEIIVVDDGSRDRSLEVIRSFRGRVLSEASRNRGGNATRNRLLELAGGEWVQYLDADDYLLPNKIEQQMQFIGQRSDNVDVVVGPATWEYWSEQGSRRELMPVPEPHDFWSLLANWGLPQTGAPLWRKQAILDVGGWNPSQPCCQEHELYLRLLMGQKRFAYSGTNGAIYRQWSNDTVCKRDITEVHRRRLEIEQRLEHHLRQTAQLTSGRLRAISQARFEIARGAWQYDREFAQKVVAGLLASDPSFAPRGAAAPAHYRAVFRSLGFRAAEQAADVYRRWRPAV